MVFLDMEIGNWILDFLWIGFLDFCLWKVLDFS